jgi:hypothetical protein
MLFLPEMNKGLPVLIVGAIAAAGFFLYRNFMDFSKTYQVRVGRMKFNSRETLQALFSKIFVDVDLIVKNPTNFTGTVTAIKLNFIFNQRIIASIEKTTNTAISKQSDTVLPVTAGINTLSLFPSIDEAIKQVKSGKPINIQIIGTVLTNYGTVNLNNVATLSA